MNFEWIAIGAVAAIVLLTDLSTVGHILGSLFGLSVWLAVFASFRISRAVNGENSPLVYGYAAILTAVFRHLEIVAIMPHLGGYSPAPTLARIIWPVVAAILVVAVVNLIIKLRAKKR